MIRRSAVHKKSLAENRERKENPRAQHILTVLNDTRALTVVVTKPFMIPLNTFRVRKACFF
jgi:hypothetical protein